MRQADALAEMKITTLREVREWKEDMPVELWVNRGGRLVLRAYNEDGHNSTEIDVFDLLAWLKLGNVFDEWKPNTVPSLSAS
jgi:hypothetical protein